MLFNTSQYAFAERPDSARQATGRASMAWLAAAGERVDAAWLRAAYVLGLRPAVYLGTILLVLLWPPHAAQRFIYFQF